MADQSTSPECNVAACDTIAIAPCWVDPKTEWINYRLVGKDSTIYFSEHPKLEAQSFSSTRLASDGSEPTEIIFLPEPSGSLMLLAGVVGLAVLRRFRG